MIHCLFEQCVLLCLAICTEALNTYQAEKKVILIKCDFSCEYQLPKITEVTKVSKYEFENRFQTLNFWYLSYQ